MSFNRFRPLLVWLALLAWAAPVSAAPAARVYVLLWFDTEDYLLPADDDAALHLAEFLTAQKIRGTFKVVGEKARVLEKRGRNDVIAALKKHEIGYHSNFHSVQPTPALYLSNLGWDEGVAEFDRREGQGRADVERIFGVKPTTYGQPGSSWGPQTYGTMKRWGMNVYLDAGRHVQLDDKPHYYCGLLNLYRLAHQTRADLRAGKPGLTTACDRFAEARNALLSEGGGVVSVVYHPCEFVHEEFWDGVNFRNGANPPREEWKLPRAKSADDVKAAYQIFEDYVTFMKRFPEVRFITASEAADLYRDSARGRRFDKVDLRALAEGVGSEVTYQRGRDFAVSPAEVLSLLARYVAGQADAESTLSLDLSPYGPTGTVPVLKESVTTDRSQFLRTTADVADYLKKHERVPSAVWLGSVGVPPEAFLRTLAEVALAQIDGKPVSDKLEVKPTKFAAGRYVADEDPKLWSWVIFPPNFKAPELMNLARRQAWTIKPALLAAQ